MLVFILRQLWNFRFSWKPVAKMHSLLTLLSKKDHFYESQFWLIRGILNYAMLRPHIVYLALRRFLFLKRMPISQDVA